MQLTATDVVLESKIYLFREYRVMIDADLAELYGVSTKRLNEQVHRNSRRFPSDFMFQLNTDEAKALRSQIATSKMEQRRGGRRYLPFAFTEQGVAMLSSVLNSERAIQVNIAIMRVFVRLKGLLIRKDELAARLEQLEERSDTQDAKILSIFNAIGELIDPKRPRRRIGFKLPRRAQTER